jgi:paraquat-inducible protein B
MDPGKEGAPQRRFKGLEIPPVVTTGMPGREFLLRATTLGSLDIGAPVYYRQIQVGQVIGYDLNEEGQSLKVKIFINAPHDKLVRKNTRFWNASGFDLKLDASGLTLNTESMVSIMMGGIAFDTPTSLEVGGPAQEGQVFRLYETRASIFERIYTEKVHYILNFNESIRGLTVGAPVEFRGIKIGHVIDIKSEFDLEKESPQITVLVETEPQRWKIAGTAQEITVEDSKEAIEKLVAKGLRAQLKTGSLLTGQLFVNVDFFPDAPKSEVKFGDKFPELPTIPAPLQIITARVNELLSKLETVPIEKIGKDLGDTLHNVKRLSESKELLEAVQALNQTLQQTRQLVQNLDSNVAPAISSTLDQAQKTLVSVEGTLGQDSPLSACRSYSLRLSGTTSGSPHLWERKSKMKRIGFLKTVTLVVLFTMLLLTGCGSSSQRVEFYTLNPLTGMPAEANTPATDQKLSIGVGPVEIRSPPDCYPQRSE